MKKHTAKFAKLGILLSCFMLIFGLVIANRVTYAQAEAIEAQEVIIVQTQAEFDALLASSNWFGAENIIFVGNGGTFEFTRSTIGIKIPQTVKTIDGINNAKIRITNLATGAGIWYASRPSQGYIKNINLIVEGTGTTVGFESCYNLQNCTSTTAGLTTYAFSRCVKLTDCTGNVTVVGTKSGNGYCFENCVDLTNCIAVNTDDHRSTFKGFINCSNLNGCSATLTGGMVYGFVSSDDLANCISTVTVTNYMGNAFGIYDCTNLINCDSFAATNSGMAIAFFSCEVLTSCWGLGSAYQGYGYGFYNCEDLIDCIGNVG